MIAIMDQEPVGTGRRPEKNVVVLFQDDILFRTSSGTDGLLIREIRNNYIGKRLSDKEKFEALKCNCVLPSNFKYPSKVEYGKHRSFNQQWVNEYVWLSYSPFQDGVYCKYCALFSDSTKIDKLVKSPLHFWTTATQKFKKHSESESHQRASILANNLLYPQI